MKMCCFGSLNIDLVFQVPHFVRPKETLAAHRMDRHVGGKGLNQAMAIAKANGHVYLAGNIGTDGQFLLDVAKAAGVHVDLVRQTDGPTGIAVIQVEEEGENCILLHGGANHKNDASYIHAVLNTLEKGDYLILQNEINGLEEIMRSAHEKGIRIFFNPSPYTSSIQTLPLECVNYMILNEVEGEQLFGEGLPEDVLKASNQRFPDMTCILTLGSKGVAFLEEGRFRTLPAYPVKAVDTTGAGDAFTGYFIAGLHQNLSLKMAIDLGIRAAGLAVTKHGASEALPTRAEVEAFLPIP